MIRLLIITQLLGFLSSTLCAQNIGSDTDLTTTFTQNDVEIKDDLRKGSILRKRNAETGLFIKDYNTQSDKSRLSLLYHVNSDLKHLSGLQTLEAIYAYRFNEIWLELFGLKTFGKFNELTTTNPNETTASTELLNSGDTVMALGASIALRDNWISHLVNSDKIFTTTAAGIGWYSFTENLKGKTYSGPGLKADFGIHRRATRTMHYGVKLSYNLASVKRPADFENESSSKRAQTLTWLTLGFDISFYF